MNKKTTVGLALVAAMAMMACSSSDDVDTFQPWDGGAGGGGAGGSGGGGAGGSGGGGAASAGLDIVWESRLLSNESIHQCDAPEANVEIDPLTVDSDGGDYLLMLSVPETWVTQDGIGGIYCLTVDDANVDCAWFNSANGSQRVPVTVVSLANLGPGTHTIGARWFCSHGTAEMRIGTAHGMWLMAMRADGAEKTARPGDAGTLSLSDGVWTDIDLDPTHLAIDSAGDDYLFVLNVPMTRLTAVGPLAHYRILLDAEPLAGGVVSSGTAGQFVPTTIFGAANLPAGPHTIRAQVLSPSDGSSVEIAQDCGTSLIAMPMAQGIVHGELADGQELVGGGAAIDFDALSLESPGGDHLFILNAADNWLSTSSAWTTFMLAVDGDPLSSGVHSALTDQRIPMTLVGVKSLAAGSHPITAHWGNETGVTSHLGSLYPARLIGL